MRISDKRNALSNVAKRKCRQLLTVVKQSQSGHTWSLCERNRTGRKTFRSRNKWDLKRSYPNDRTSFLSNFTTATNCNRVASVFWWHHKKLSRSHSVFFSMYLSPKCVQCAFNVLSWMDMTWAIAQRSGTCIQRDRQKRKTPRKKRRISSCDRASRNKKFSLCWPWPAFTCDTYHSSVGYQRYAIKSKLSVYSPTDSPRARSRIECNGWRVDTLSSKSIAVWVHKRNVRLMCEYISVFMNPFSHFDAIIDGRCYYW